MDLLRRIVNRARWWRRSSFRTLRGPGGDKWVVDQATMEYINSTAPQPTQADLDRLMDAVGAVRVFREGCRGDKLLGKDLLLETREPTDLAALRATMKIVDGPGGHCMCFGGPTLEVLSADGSRLALLSIHHGLAIRWHQWKDDARLVDGRLLLEWLAQRGVGGPLRDFEQEEERRIQGKKDWERWLAAMPTALEDVWSEALGEFGMVDARPLRIALEREMPDEGERILALLEWFGSGAGPWSGFPSYESVAEDLLLGYSTERLVEVAESVPLSSAQLEGAARLFAGWSFNKQRPQEVRDIPDALRKALWSHVKDTPDSDKRRRASHALAG